MKTNRMILLGAALALAAVGCKNPASGKPKAKVGEASAEKAGGPAPAETVKLDEGNTTVGFVGSKVTGSHEGSFKKLAGRVELAGDKPEQSKVVIDIDMTSVAVDPDKLLGHLKSKDFFDVETYPTANFTSTEIKPGDAAGTYLITGNLDLHGVKKSISFPATVEITPATVKAKSEFSINRKDFNIVYPGMPDDLIRDEVLLKLNVEAPRSKS